MMIADLVRRTLLVILPTFNIPVHDHHKILTFSQLLALASACIVMSELVFSRWNCHYCNGSVTTTDGSLSFSSAAKRKVGEQGMTGRKGRVHFIPAWPAFQNFSWLTDHRPNPSGIRDSRRVECKMGRDWHVTMVCPPVVYKPKAIGTN